MDKYTALKHYFGHDQFREGQETLIDAILSGRDVMGVMPTGGGKSLCYQIPALLLPGVTLVISPLISLMKDQVSALNRSGVSAAFINSSLSAQQIAQVCEQVQSGGCRLLYIAPERLELCNLGKVFPAQGTGGELQREFGLDAESLANKAAEVLQ